MGSYGVSVLGWLTYTLFIIAGSLLVAFVWQHLIGAFLFAVLFLTTMLVVGTVIARRKRRGR
jgi:hypothetical protein